MHSTKQLATVIAENTEEVENTDISSVDKCQQLCDKCDVVLDKIKSKKAQRRKTIVEIK